METMCPGQDTRYWQPGDVFEVECGECGYKVEFFKDDAQRRCPECGSRVSNPKLNLGCAQWCEHAKECLGYDPKEKAAEAGGSHDALTDRLIAALKSELKATDEGAFPQMVKVLEKAGELLRKEGGKPKVTLSAAVLVNLEPVPGKPLRAMRIMKEAGLDKYPLEEAAAIISDFHSGRNNDSLEYKIVADAVRLAELDNNDGSRSDKEGDGETKETFRTKAGKEAAEAAPSNAVTG